MNIYFIASEDNKVFGVGQTKRSFAERHKDGDWSKFHNYLAARGEELQLIHWWEDVDVVDHDIHAWLKKQPGIRKFAEWFSHSSSLDVIRQQIQDKFFSDYKDTKTDLVLKPYQKAFVDKARPDYEEFLLAAKCRAGKSVMVLSHIADKEHKVSLVVSRFTSPSQSWLKDTEKFDSFSNLVTVNLKDRNWKEQLEFWLTTDKQVILWSTVQGLTRKIHSLTEITPVNLLVFDEAHVGDNSKQFRQVRQLLSQTPCLKVSGTAYDQLWDTTEENRFVYDYWQEQLDVSLGIIDRPKMNVVLVQYDSEGYNNLYADDPDAMKNLFMVSDGKFLNEQLVREFITQYLDQRKTHKPQDRLLKDSNHIYMTLPSVESCHLFAELVGGVIPAKVVTGDTKSDADDINQFIQEHNRTLCLTYSANVLGTTAQWDTVINCRQGKSVQFWNQFAFRGGSGDHDWTVIDFVPNRALVSLRETYCLANDLDPQLSEYEFTDFVPIHEWNAGFETLSQERVNELLAADIGSTATLMSGGTKDVNLVALSDFEFDHYEKFGKEVTKCLVMNEDEGNDGTSAKRLVSERSKGEATDLQKKIDTIKSILALIPQVILEERNIGHHINTIQDVIQCETYPHLTGDTGLLSELLEAGVLQSQGLTRRVVQTRQSVDNALAQDEMDRAFEELQVVTGTQKGVPSDLFCSMINV